MTQYEVGDRISMVVNRSWLDIWWDRVTTFRWHVPMTEKRWFQCTSTSAGSIWPEVK